MRKINILVIDPQSDFVLPSGALSVPGADKDMDNLAALIDRRGDSINDIKVTLDSHHRLHIAHPEWFKDKNGNHPTPFTLMREKDGVIQSYDPATHDTTGEWVCSIPGMTNWTLDYLRSLQSGGRYPHCIWNPHCLIGSEGHAVYKPLYDSLQNWCLKNLAVVSWLTKGSNPRTEHFSAVRAEVPDPQDPSTQINTTFIEDLMDCDEIWLAGEALNFCVANTINDTLDFAGEEFARKLILLEDCSSEIMGFEHLTEAFMKRLTAAGMRTVKSTDL